MVLVWEAKVVIVVVDADQRQKRTKNTVTSDWGESTHCSLGDFNEILDK